MTLFFMINISFYCFSNLFVNELPMRFDSFRFLLLYSYAFELGLKNNKRIGM